MKAQIFSIGTEILLGNITDTNSRYIADKLTTFGIDVYKMITVGDNFQRLEKEIKSALEDVDYIFMTGGLGPTEDDISKEVAIKICGKEDEIIVDKKSEERLKKYFKGDKKAMAINIKQAKFPKDAIILENDLGTAPGAIFEAKNKTKLILLPGPPREMQYMFENKLIKYIKKEAIIESKILRIGLLGEWDMASRIDLSSTNPTISPYFDEQGGYLRITAKAKKREEALKILDKKAKKVREVFGPFFISDDGKRKEETLIDLLKERGEKISTAESITGALIASSIIDISGASQVIEESYLTYSDRVKEKNLNVSHETLEKYSAVSEACAREMLKGLYERTKSELCIISTGYAHKGLVFLGIKYKDKSVVKKFKFMASRNRTRLWSKNRAMDLSIMLMRGVYEDNFNF